ncbi:MAG TPA: flagellar biosynthesis anti-sigma factor FlgM [Halothiobacillaceae bacterium]|nr:flagellar biosynthesis anti-sigma factor FlgM [Halothiobacillaceae bacterium]
MAGDITGLGPRNLGNTNSLDPTSRAGGDRKGSGDVTGSVENRTSNYTPAVGDALTLSTEAARMRSLSENLSEEPPFDQAKVDRIKALIDQGEYEIDSAKIAEKLRAFEQI